MRPVRCSSVLVCWRAEGRTPERVTGRVGSQKRQRSDLAEKGKQQSPLLSSDSNTGWERGIFANRRLGARQRQGRELQCEVLTSERKAEDKRRSGGCSRED